MAAILVSTLMGALSPDAAQAACLEFPSLPQQYTTALYIITGTAVSEKYIEGSPDDYFMPGDELKVHVDKVLKGSPPPYLTLFSERSSGMFPLDLSVPYVLFIEQEHGRLMVSNCGDSDYLSKSKNILAAVQRISHLPQNVEAPAHDGIWAAAGQMPNDYGNAQRKDAWSPDHKLVVQEGVYPPKGSDALALVGKHATLLQDILALSPFLEVLWAPDSKSFVVNGSDGGQVGKWGVHFYTVDDEDRPVARDLANLIVPLVRDFPQCDGDAPYTNLGAVAWLNDGKELLVAAEVPGHSPCRNMGAVKAFRISVTSWKVIEQISAAKLRRDWAGVLGPRLQ
ncbi:MAG: hypothetical protein EPO08_01230 [Rhodospirillaceae bacterium]|nr:MAG: hypothetical protein EPO08_01230 [Rhodospirillaceae bacterium]